MSRSRPSQHLTDEQFSSLLAGESPSSDVEEHLGSCEYCRGELAAVQGTLSSFNLSSLTWAQREAVRRVRTPSKWSLQVASMPGWAIALAGTGAAFLLAAGLGLPFQHETDQVAAQVVIPVPSDAEIAKDNQMMASIDQELQYNAQPAFPAAELRVSVRVRQRREIVLSN